MEQFWTRRRREYIEVKMNWNPEHHNLTVGDMMTKDEQTHRNNWPLGRVVRASRSEDGRVRKATVLIGSDGQRKTYK